MVSAPKTVTQPNDWFKKLDADSNGKVTLSEFLARNKAEAEKKGRAFDEKKARSKFKFIDSNGDGFVIWAELEASK